ncbi:protein SMG9 [Harpegnathos saltator]|uniref:protein SMG9 n=1 Tax=Harpegnathos saltator TaxID=610380 RepID=UPI0005908810|nr:protein SMG9 [Harpegnathos saltator]
MREREMLPTTPKDSEIKDGENKTLIKIVERPTFILKTREGENRAVSPSQRNGHKKDNDAAAATKSQETIRILSTYPEMISCFKFMDENMQLCESAIEYLYDQQDFLVVGCLGTQSVGKSTIMSLLTHEDMPDIFPVQDLSHHESATNCTTGIDIFITKNRVIYLDTQPVLSISAFDNSTSSFDQKKTVSDFTNTETNLELQSLQFMAFMFSVCHVIIFVQDWCCDLNSVRLLQTAEMLKPSSTTTMDQDYVEYYPHLIFLHNKAEPQDFMPSSIERMKDFYKKTFSSSRLQTHSGIDMSQDSTENGLNLFLIPSNLNRNKEASTEDIFFGESEKSLLDKLRRKIHGVTKNPMTPSVLTEKNWYHYVSKVIEAIKKSHLSSEYGRLMP